MSTIFLGEKHTKIADENGRLFCLPKPIAESPQDYVRRIIAEKGLSHVKVAQRAKKLGGELSPGYVNSIIQGHVKSPSIDMLYSLSLGLGEPVEDLIAIYLGRLAPNSHHEETIYIRAFDSWIVHRAVCWRYEFASMRSR